MSRLRHYLAAIRGHDRPVRFVLAWLLAITIGARWVRIDRGGYRLALHPTNLSVLFWTYPGYRRDEEAFIASLLRPGDNVIDVGANVGSVTCAAAAAVGPTGTVVAIEAHPRTAACLRRNVRLNDFQNVTVIQTAVDERPGIVQFESRSADDKNAIAPDSRGISVAANRIDSLDLGAARYRLLKIDIEGYELPALRGATDVLARVDAIWFECGRRLTARFGYKPRDVLAFLRGQGFRIFRARQSVMVEIDNIDDEEVVDLFAARSIDDFPLTVA